MRRHALAFAVVLAATSVARVPHADDAGDRRAAVVARVGKRAVTVGELEDKLARVAPFQLQAYGKTPEEAKKKFLKTIIIPKLKRPTIKDFFMIIPLNSEFSDK